MNRGFESRSADWLSVDEALDRILESARPLAPEEVQLSEALGRALAQDVLAEASLPPWDNSAMDGFAVRASDIAAASASAPVELRVTGRVRAGEPADVQVAPGEAVRIMTGAPIPSGADSVVRVEDTDGEANSGLVRIQDARDAGQNVRPMGRDMRPGQLLVPRGATVTAGTVGAIAAGGRSRVLVGRMPSVAVLTTGDELRGPDRFEDVKAGVGIPDSNGPMLAAMAVEVGASPVELPTAPDHPDALRGLIDRAASADVLVTVGGASMGEADLVKRVLDEMGYEPDFWRVRMRPGSPVGYGTLPRGDRVQPVFSLPGNPSSAFVTFEVFVRPFLLAMGGHARWRRRTIRCAVGEPLRTPARLTHFLRVSVEGDGAEAVARPCGSQSSGLVGGLAKADGLAIVPEEAAAVEVGQEVDVMLIRGP